jgi:hypothetical protein
MNVTAGIQSVGAPPVVATAARPAAMAPGRVGVPPETRAVAKAREAATVGKGFEEMLVRQLLRASGLKAFGSEGSNGYGSMALDALATAIVSGGGLGLAAQLGRSLGVPTAAPSLSASSSTALSRSREWSPKGL